MRTKVLILGLICLLIFAFCNSPADPEIEKALKFANVTMIYGPKGSLLFNLYSRPQYRFRVEGGVKNIGDKLALNTQVSIKVWSFNDTLLFSGETMVGDGKLEPQQYASWYIIFESVYDFIYEIVDIINLLKNERYEIKYEITWE